MYLVQTNQLHKKAVYLAAAPYTVYTHLSTLMQKSPLMVPGLESAGLVAPSITLPVFTTPLPSHTWRKQRDNIKMSAVSTFPVLEIWSNSSGSNSLEQSVVSDSYHGNHWTRAHVLHEGRKEWFILQVAVVIHQEILRGLQQETAQFYYSLFQLCPFPQHVSSAVSRVYNPPH